MPVLPPRIAARVLLLVVLVFGMALPALEAPAVTATTPAAAADKVDAAIPRTAAPTSVIVRSSPGRVFAARDAVTDAGGEIVAVLPIIDGFEASLPGTAVETVAESAAVVSISANVSALFEEYSYDDTTTASSFARTSGATTGWARGALGQGIGVAVLDTGVSPQNDFSGRLVHGPDLSGEGTIIDNYGHGTVMAGIVGGSGADSNGRVGGAYTGVAPLSTIVAVKTAGRNGAVDVSTMLQAMHWVAAYKDQFNIRVLNLSWGTKSTQSPTVDPLNYAVQRLWNSGIVVVVAAGNSGPQSGTVTKPGDDPMVITVGAFDDKANLEAGDDSMSPWSSRGPTPTGLRKPDILAPGRSLIAPRSFGSHVEVDNPKALIAPSYIKGSGTSQAAAVVSGLVAQMLSARPSLTPNQVKALLRGTSTPITGVAADAQGTGRVQLGSALAAATPLLSTQVSTASGLGSIEASRGGMNVVTDCQGDGIADTIIGEIDVRCQPWQPAAWTGNAWTGNAWTGNAWTGNAWTGSSWTGSAWTTAGYGDWTTAEYEEFLTAWWGPEPPARFAALGEKPDPAELVPDHVTLPADAGPPAEIGPPATPPGNVPETPPGLLPVKPAKPVLPTVPVAD